MSGQISRGVTFKEQGWVVPPLTQPNRIVKDWDDYYKNPKQGNKAESGPVLKRSNVDGSSTQETLFNFNSNQRNRNCINILFITHQITKVMNLNQCQHRRGKIYSLVLYWWNNWNNFLKNNLTVFCFALVWFGLTSFKLGIVCGAEDGVQDKAHRVTSPPIREIFNPKNEYGLWTGIP